MITCLTENTTSIASQFLFRTVRSDETPDEKLIAKYRAEINTPSGGGIVSRFLANLPGYHPQPSIPPSVSFVLFPIIAPLNLLCVAHFVFGSGISRRRCCGTSVIDVSAGTQLQAPAVTTTSVTFIIGRDHRIV